MRIIYQLFNISKNCAKRFTCGELEAVPSEGKRKSNFSNFLNLATNGEMWDKSDCRPGLNDYQNYE